MIKVWCLWYHADYIKMAEASVSIVHGHPMFGIMPISIPLTAKVGKEKREWSHHHNSFDFVHCMCVWWWGSVTHIYTLQMEVADLEVSKSWGPTSDLEHSKIKTKMSPFIIPKT